MGETANREDRVARFLSTCTQCDDHRLSDDVGPRRIAAVSMLLLALVACGSEGQEKYLERLLAEARAECERQGQPMVVSRPTLTGYLRSTNRIATYSYHDLTRELLGKQLTFLEFPNGQFVDNGEMMRSSEDSLAKYLRYSLADRGAPECDAFERQLARHPRRRLIDLRRLGLPASSCIAVVPVSEAMSEFEFQEEFSEPSRRHGYVTFVDQRTLIDRRSGEVLWSVRNNGVRDRGFRRKGGKNLPRSFACHSQSEMRSYQDASVEIQPNPMLRRVVNTVVVQSPTASILDPRGARYLGPDQSGHVAPTHWSDAGDPTVEAQGSVFIELGALHIIDGADEFVTSLREPLAHGHVVAFASFDAGVMVLARTNQNPGTRQGSAPKFRQPYLIAWVTGHGRQIAITPIELSEPERKGEYLAFRILKLDGDAMDIVALDANQFRRPRDTVLQAHLFRVEGLRVD